MPWFLTIKMGMKYPHIVIMKVKWVNVYKASRTAPGIQTSMYKYWVWFFWSWWATQKSHVGNTTLHFPSMSYKLHWVPDEGFGLRLETILHGECVSLTFKLAFSTQRCPHSGSSEGRFKITQGSSRLPCPFQNRSGEHIQNEMLGRLAYCLYSYMK